MYARSARSFATSMASLLPHVHAPVAPALLGRSARSSCATASWSPLPRRSGRAALRPSRSTRAVVASLDVDPGQGPVAGVTQLLFSVADAAVQSGVAAAPELDAAAKAAEQLAANKTGFLGGIANLLEGLLEGIDGVLAAAHVPYSYGFSIIVLTLLVKAATFPLSKKQIESTAAMQAMQPRVKELQARYANDQETLQRETALMYQKAGVNPLAGCLPTLATLPVFIGLYRALTNAAGDGLLTEGFFWIPSLGGPATSADNLAGRGLSWLFPLVDGAPPIGWHDAGAYLVLPVLLVVSQFASQKIMQPQQSTDPSQAQANAILKFLPFMIGWFSLNVPAGLTLYWIVNNVITTAQTVYLRNNVSAAPAAGAGGAMPKGGASSFAASLPPNPPRVEQRQPVQVGARNGAIDVEVLSRDGSSSRGDSGPAPGSRFAQLKAAEKSGSSKNRQRRPGSSSSGNITWAAPSQGESQQQGGSSEPPASD